MIIFSAFIFISLIVSSVDAKIKNEHNNIWKEFRNIFPFHIQLIGVSGHMKDGNCMIIISEPPPYVTISSFRKLFPKQFIDVYEMKHPIGYDGWVKDLIIIFRPLSISELDLFLTQIQLYVFQTTYKATIVNLPIAKSNLPSSINLNLQVNAEELKQWLIDESEKFISVNTGDKVKLEELFENALYGVFVSEKPGFTLWSIPLNSDIMDFVIETRQFTLDSDLILGAISNDKTLLIIGRERIVPLHILPPLRTETILLLAAVNSEDLGQSYERTHILAGKMDDNKDWAPIYLSDSLIHTEYGSLLNITDQLLKSWSLNGRVSYVNFNYPTPSHWPFEKPLSDIMKTESLTFNWNTKGAGAMYKVDEYNIFAINRSGSLSVSYIPGESPDSAEKYEKIAYDYFSGMSDANLVRVVQYAALYSIFKNFNVKCTFPVTNERQHSENVVVQKEIFKLLNKIRLLKSKDIENTVAQYINKHQKTFEKQSSKYGKTVDVAVVKSNLISKIEDIQIVLQQIYTKYGDDGIKILADFFVDRKKMKLLYEVMNGKKHSSTMNQVEMVVGTVALMLLEEQVPNLIGELFINRSGVKNTYATACQEKNPGWIQTASIVLSSDTNEMYIGGHNLYSKVPKFRVGSNVRAGQIEVIEEGGNQVILFNKKDLGKIEQLKWQAGRNADNPNLSKVLNTSLGKINAQPIRPRINALELPPNLGAYRTNVYRNVSYFPSEAKQTKKIGYAVAKTEKTGQKIRFIDDAAIEKLPSQTTVKIERTQGNLFSMSVKNSKMTVEAAGMDNLVEACARKMNTFSNKKESLNMVLTDFTGDEAQGFIKNFELAAFRQEQILKETYLKGQTGIKGFFKRIKWYVSSNFLPKHTYNFAKAEIKIGQIETISDGILKGHQKMTYEIHIPCELEMPRVFNIRLFFKKGTVSRELNNKVEIIIKDTFINAEKRNLEIENIPKEIKTRLKDYIHDMEFIYKGETVDVYIVELFKLDRNETNGHKTT